MTLRARTYSTSSLRALSYRFAVRTDDVRVGRRLDQLFGALRDQGPVEHWFSLTASGSVPAPRSGGATASETTFDLCRDGILLTRCLPAADAIAWLMWEVNRAAADSAHQHLLLHAGAVEAAGAGVLMPAPSGSGKSTLSAALTASGLGYLSDELVALDLSSGQMLPYPKPITMKPGPGLRALCELHPESGAGLVGSRTAAGEIQLAVDSVLGQVGEPCVPQFVVVPRYVPGAPTSLTPLTETQAFFEVAANAVNFSQHGEAATAVVGALVGRCECALLTTSDLDEACRLVLELTGARVVEHAH